MAPTANRLAPHGVKFESSAYRPNNMTKTTSTPMGKKLWGIKASQPPSESGQIVIIGGGTICPMNEYTALCAPSFGKMAHQLTRAFRVHPDNKMRVNQVLSSMAGGYFNTIEGLEEIANSLVEDASVKVVILAASVCSPNENDEITREAYAGADTIIPILLSREDLFVVGFSTTFGCTDEEAETLGRDLMNETGLHMIVVNDPQTRTNFVIDRDGNKSSETTDRDRLATIIANMTFKNLEKE